MIDCLFWDACNRLVGSDCLSLWSGLSAWDFLSQFSSWLDEQVSMCACTLCTMLGEFHENKCTNLWCILNWIGCSKQTLSLRTLSRLICNFIIVLLSKQGQCCMHWLHSYIFNFILQYLPTCYRWQDWLSSPLRYPPFWLTKYVLSVVSAVTQPTIKLSFPFSAFAVWSKRGADRVGVLVWTTAIHACLFSSRKILRQTCEF